MIKHIIIIRGRRNVKKISAILFSGGLDSSLAVCDMIEKGYDVHLLHYDTGALISNNLIKIRYAELKKYMKSVLLIYMNVILVDYSGELH